MRTPGLLPLCSGRQPASCTFPGESLEEEAQVFLKSGALGIETGDRVTFIVDGANVRVVNSAVYAMMRFQEQMKGQAKQVGMLTEEDVAAWITQSRREENDE